MKQVNEALVRLARGLAVLGAAALMPMAAPAQTPAAPPAVLQSQATVAATAAPGNKTDAKSIPAGQPGSANPAPAPVSTFQHLLPDAREGEPSAAVDLQPQATAIGQRAANMHNYILMPVMTAISLLVLALLAYVVIRFRASANPVPSRTSHNTFIEVIWTLAPVLILVVIAVPSIGLLRAQYSPPKADLTVKVIGNQWYWTYQYPDNGDFEVVSNMLKEKDEVVGKERPRTDADGPRQLAVDERMVVPAGKVVKIITTSNDVIHSFAVPAFWTKMDAVPGRLNETWFKVDRPGVYFGQCSELCGARHGYMPIAVEVVPPARFAEWVASKGGKMPGAAPARNPDATSPASPATAGTAPGAGTPAAGPDGQITSPKPTTQGATGNQGPNAQ